MKAMALAVGTLVKVPNSTDIEISGSVALVQLYTVYNRVKKCYTMVWLRVRKPHLVLNFGSLGGDYQVSLKL